MTTKDARWYVATASKRRLSHLGTSWYVATTSQIGQFYLRTSETLRDV